MTQSTWILNKCEPGTYNLFNLSEPESYGCHILSYGAGHSVLLIEFMKFNSNKPLYLIFNNVTYFDGPMRWHGANFCLAHSQDWINIMVTRIYDGFPPDEFREIYPEQSELIVIHKIGYLIQIVATSVELTDDFDTIRLFVG